LLIRRPWFLVDARPGGGNSSLCAAVGPFRGDVVAGVSRVRLAAADPANAERQRDLEKARQKISGLDG
jgi:hypothetical protein